MNDHHDDEELFARHLAEQEAIHESILQLQLQPQQQQQQQQEVIEEEEALLLEAALNASKQEQQKLQDEALAASLHRDEVHCADQEYATAIQESDHHATAVEWNECMTSAAKRYKTSRNDDVAQGSWDCPHCTYTNPPYRAQTCGMCHAAPPINVLTFSPISPTLRFGVEIEIIIPRGKQDLGYTLPRLAQELTRLGPPNVHFRGYTHETEAGADWKLVTDASIVGTTRSSNDEDENDADLCFELVSPILVGDDGLASMRSILDHVRRLGVATNSTCGFHVHVDAEPNHGTPSPVSSLAALKRLCQCFCCLENAFDLLVASSTWDDKKNENGTNTSSNSQDHRRANANEYCRSNRLLLGTAGGMSNRQVYNKIAAARSRADLVHNIINPEPAGRYCKLNLTNITKTSRPSTVEFRHHGGVEDLLEAEAWVRLILRFCQAAGATLTNAQVEQMCVSSSGSSSSSAASPTTTATAMARAEVEALFDMVGCQGLAQFYIVERRLFAGEHRFRNTWPCTICGKVFETCQSLSQHVQARRHL
jgi:Putative amidoligase enzyme